MAPPKKQQQKLSLGDFLSDQTLGSWADEMEDMPLGTSGAPAGYGGGQRTFGSAGGYADRGFASTNDRNYAVREALPLPTKPPYTAHLGNLSFDATEGDITDFFSGCEVTNVRIVEDKMERKPKGFGYVEFGSLDGLKKALELNGTQFQGRNIRISVAEPPKDREGQREITDWTRKGPLPDLPGGNRRVSERTGGYRTFGDNGSDAGSERGGERRRPAFESDGKVRDFSNWERKGPLSPAPSTGGGMGGGMREGGRVRSNDGPRPERRQSPAWGEGRSNEGSRPPRREFADRPQYDRAPTAPEMDNQWRSKMRPDAPPAKSPGATPETSVPSSPATSHAAPHAAPTSRPKLNLAKRTVSESEPGPASAASSSDSKPNPFGAARPIDTAAKEKEIEEKRQLAVRQKEEQAQKAREEKKAKEAAAKAADKEKGAQTPTSPKEAPKETKENGEDKPASKNYEILRRMDDENGETDEAEDDAVDAPANGNIVDDKAVKPKEVVRNPPKAEGGAWRRKSSTPATPNESTTQGMEDDGWSTVPQKTSKGRRGGPGGSRAIAS